VNPDPGHAAGRGTVTGRRGTQQPRGADRVRWAGVLERGAVLVNAEPVGMTLRGLFYRLVSEERLRNSTSHYKILSRETAKARRAGWFRASSIRAGRSSDPEPTPVQTRPWTGSVRRTAATAPTARTGRSLSAWRRTRWLA
jgi:hypothetical protein